jgi:hypothetical protein
MSRSFPQRGSYVVGLSSNQLLGSTEDPKQDNGEIVNHLNFAHSYSEEEAKHYAKQGFSVFLVEPGLRLRTVDFFPDIPKHKPFDIPIQKETNELNDSKKIFARIESKHGCKFCSVRYLKVGTNATVCGVCKKHLKCNSCGRCICESWR